MLLRASAPRTAAAAALDVTEKSLTDLQAAMTSGQSRPSTWYTRTWSALLPTISKVQR